MGDEHPNADDVMSMYPDTGRDMCRIQCKGCRVRIYRTLPHSLPTKRRRVGDDRAMRHNFHSTVWPSTVGKYTISCTLPCHSSSSTHISIPLVFPCPSLTPTLHLASLSSPSKPSATHDDAIVTVPYSCNDNAMCGTSPTHLHFAAQQRPGCCSVKVCFLFLILILTDIYFCRYYIYIEVNVIAHPDDLAQTTTMHTPTQTTCTPLSRHVRLRTHLYSPHMPRTTCMPPRHRDDTYTHSDDLDLYANTRDGVKRTPDKEGCTPCRRRARIPRQ